LTGNGPPATLDSVWTPLVLTCHALTCAEGIGGGFLLPSGSLSPATLGHRLRQLQGWGYEFITCGELARRLPLGGTGRPLAVLTCDDGYRDVSDVILPITHELRIPATVFVVTQCLDQGRPPWPLRLRWLVENSWQPERAETQLQRVVRRLHAMHAIEINRYLEKLQRVWGIPGRCDGWMMEWDGLARLRDAGWEVASHSVTHRWLPDLTEDERRFELRASRAVLEDRLGQPVAGLCVPRGAVEDLEAVASIVRDAGYTYVATSLHGRPRSRRDGLWVFARTHVIEEPSWKFLLRAQGWVEHAGALRARLRGY
jgi:peptidoglycan/xylan/chitin deacetylase (PgdA/CDA1 family)